MAAILSRPQCVNSLWSSDVIWWHKYGSTLSVQVMACCLTAPSHFPNQCWLICNIQWYSLVISQHLLKIGAVRNQAPIIWVKLDIFFRARLSNVIWTTISQIASVVTSSQQPLDHCKVPNLLTRGNYATKATYVRIESMPKQPNCQTSNLSNGACQLSVPHISQSLLGTVRESLVG